MNELVFAKFSPERREEYRLITELWKDEGGHILVQKRAHTPEASAHLASIARKQQLLSGFYGNIAGINRCILCENGTLAIEYLDGPSLEQILDRKREGEGLDAAAMELKKQLDSLIPVERQEPFCLTEAFQKWFGTPPVVPDEWMCLPVSNLDMIPSNVIFRGTQRVLLDYEWTFDFPVPADFLRYRVVFYYFFRHAAGLEISDRAAFYARFGIKPAELPFWQKMEEHFQTQILKTKAEACAPEKMEDRPADNVIGSVHGDPDVLQIYWKQGNGWAEENSVRFDMDERTADLDIAVPAGTVCLRIDPGDVPCICEVEGLAVCRDGEAVPFELAVNGVLLHHRRILFFRADPQIHLSFSAGETQEAAAEKTGGTAPGTVLSLRLRTWGTAEEILQEAEEQIRSMKARIDGIEASRAYRLYRILKPKPKD